MCIICLSIYIYEHKDDNTRGQRAHMPFYCRNLPASRGPCAAALYDLSFSFNSTAREPEALRGGLGKNM